LIGGKVLEAVELENTKTHERRTLQTPAVFSMIGAKPCTAWLPAEIERDEKGFTKTGHAIVDAPAWKGIGRSPGPLETSWPGITLRRRAKTPGEQTPWGFDFYQFGL